MERSKGDLAGEYMTWMPSGDVFGTSLSPYISSLLTVLVLSMFLLHLISELQPPVGLPVCLSCYLLIYHPQGSKNDLYKSSVLTVSPPPPSHPLQPPKTYSGSSLTLGQSLMHQTFKSNRSWSLLSDFGPCLPSSRPTHSAF